MAVPFAALRLNPARDLTAFALVGAALMAWRWTEFARCLEIGDGSRTQRAHSNASKTAVPASS